MGLEGEVNFKFLPKNVRSIHLGSRNGMVWSPDTNGVLRLRSSCLTNSLKGEIEFSALPHNLEKLNIQNNQFEGVITLKELPKQIKEIILSHNRGIRGKFELGIEGEHRSDESFARINSGCVVLKSHKLLPDSERCLIEFFNTSINIMNSNRYR
ncbi:MAG: hypothetical protein AAGG81_06855 [Chlamydiota bacterium]